MKKISFVIASLLLISCNNKYALATDSDKQATRESADTILNYLPNWTITDSLWWNYDEKSDDFTYQRICLQYTITKGNDTLYIETSEMFGSDYLDGSIRYPYTYYSTPKEINYKNKVIIEALRGIEYVEFNIDPDSIITASFSKMRK